MESIFDGQIEFKKREELDIFLKHIENPHSLKVLEMAFEFAHKCGIFSITETHVIYTCLNKLRENEKDSKVFPVHSSNDTGNDDPNV